MSAENKELVDSFYQLKTREDVAHILGTSNKQLIKLLYIKKTDNLYREYRIPKKSGGFRTINIPDKRLLNLQRKLLRILEEVYKVKPSAYGFIQGKSHVKNAERHIGKKLLLNLDLKDFFHQIHFGRVMGMLKAQPYCIGEEAAMVIAQIACYKGALPQGSPTSPIISNMICAPLDTQLTRLAKKYHMTYTRYADDISFSINISTFPKNIVQIKDNNREIVIGKELKKIIEVNSFVINENKIFVNDYYHRQEVTGVVVNKFPNLRKNYIRELRTILYDCDRNGVYQAALKYIGLKKTKNRYIIGLANGSLKGVDEEKKQEIIVDWFLQVLKGKIEYIRCVRGEHCNYFYKYASDLNRIFDVDIFEIHDFENAKNNWCYIIDGIPSQGSAFLLRGYGILTNAHVFESNPATYSVRRTGGEKVTVIDSEINTLIVNETIDYALYDFSKKDGWLMGNSDTIIEGMRVRVLSFPNYHEGDSISVTECKVTGRKQYLLKDYIWTIDKPILHGASGGAVINENNEVIGIVEAGADSMTEDNYKTMVYGFIPINRVIQDVKKKMSDGEC